jgi:hypothetical protein
MSAGNRKSRRFLAISLAVLASMRTATAFAATDTEQGTYGVGGAAGAASATGPGVNGGNGTAGGAAIANATSSDASNTATATGGYGGPGGGGGNGYPGGSGGNGANGGSATATAVGTVAVAGPASATATATGGAAGNGAAGGIGSNLVGGTYVWGYAAGGVPGNAGNAQASAIASNTTADPVTVSATATGGPGGSGGISSVLCPPGTAGGVASLGTVYGSSTGGGNVQVTGEVIGGSTPYYGAPDSGAGASETLNNAVGGFTTGTLSLTQIVYGGSDGNGWNNGGAGGGGNATSTLTLTQNGLLALVGTSEANAGTGGIGSPSAGGVADSTINLTSNGCVNAWAVSNQGEGPGSHGGGNCAGGGVAAPGETATAVATATGTSSVAGLSAVTAEAQAGGQDGGAAWNSNNYAVGGAGGAAEASATASNAGPDKLVADARAYGGYGGGGNGPGYSSGSGGNATATALATSTGSAPITAIALAVGGIGGTGAQGALNGTGGSAVAVATANGLRVEQDSPASGQSVGEANITITGTSISLGYPNNGALIVSGPMSASIGVISGGGSLAVGDGSTATTLHLNENSGGSSVSGLTVNAGSTLDISNNHVFMSYGSGSDPIATIAGYLKAGYNSGNWNGPGGIDTSAPLTVNGLKYALGYADGKDGKVVGLTSGQIEVKYTLLGDANLDGFVNGEDFTILASNFNQNITGWDQGDFNYDGTVNGEDFTLLAANFNQGTSGADVSAGDIAALDAFAVANGLSLPTSSVPEPATGSVMLLAGLGLFGRPRRRIGR